MSVTEEIVYFVNNMKPTDHVLLFYDTPQKKYDVLFNFLSAGLASGRGAAYVCSEETPEQIRTKMKAYNIDVERNEAEGKLIVRDYDVWCIQNGKSNASESWPAGKKSIRNSKRKV